jgi:hypothetical protein
MNKHILEFLNPSIGFGPVNMATGANSGDYIDLKEYEGCLVLFVKGVGTAGEDPTITLLQATDVAAGTTKALNFTRVDKKQATALTSVGTFTTVTQAAANTYTNDTLGELQAIIAIDVKAENLDVDGGYTCLHASVADVGTTSQLGIVVMIPYGPKYAKATLDSAIV